MTPDQITQVTAIVTGGAGATVLLGVIARILWVRYQETVDERIADFQAQIEDLKAQRQANLEGWRAQTAATDKLAALVERMTRLLKVKP